MIFLCTIYLNQCVTIIAPQKLGISNIYVVLTVLHIFDGIGIFLVHPYAEIISRKMLNIVCNILILVFGSLLFINDMTNSGKFHGPIALFLSAMIRMTHSS